MVVTVRLFAMLKEAAGTDTCRFAVPPGALGGDVRAALAQRYPQLDGLLASSRMARNLEYQPWGARLLDGDELCVIPPVSGG